MLRADTEFCRHRIPGYSELGGTHRGHRVRLGREWPIRGSNRDLGIGSSGRCGAGDRSEVWGCDCERGCGVRAATKPQPSPSPFTDVRQTARGGSCARWEPPAAPGCPRALAQLPGTEALATPGCRDRPQGGDSPRGPSHWFSLCVPDWNRLSQPSPAPCMSAQEMFDYSFIHPLCCRWKGGRCSCGSLCPAAAWDLVLPRSKPNSYFFPWGSPTESSAGSRRGGWLAARSRHAAAMTLAR